MGQRWTTSNHHKSCRFHLSGQQVGLGWIIGGHKWTVIGCQPGQVRVSQEFSTIIHYDVDYNYSFGYLRKTKNLNFGAVPFLILCQQFLHKITGQNGKLDTYLSCAVVLVVTESVWRGCGWKHVHVDSHFALEYTREVFWHRSTFTFIPR